MIFQVSLRSWRRKLGEVQVSLVVAGAVLDVKVSEVSLFVTGAVLGEVSSVTFCVAGAVLGEESSLDVVFCSTGR